jgi:hypothetical protein
MSVLSNKALADQPSFITNGVSSSGSPSLTTSTLTQQFFEKSSKTFIHDALISLYKTSPPKKN